MPDLIPDATNSRFTVFAIRKSSPEPLLQLNLPWERLMTDIVVPYDSGEMFFIDGAPVTATDLDRLKILVNHPGFDGRLAEINRGMRAGDPKSKEVHAKQYHVLLSAHSRLRLSPSSPIALTKSCYSMRLSNWLSKARKRGQGINKAIAFRRPVVSGHDFSLAAQRAKSKAP